MKTFGETIKHHRELKKLLLRQVGAALNIDQAIISKFERGERKPTREQVIEIAKFFKLNEQDLLITWLSDKVAYDLIEENQSSEILKVAERKIKYLRTKLSNRRN